MEFDTQQRQAALRAFIAQHGIKVSVWERASGVAEGTVRHFLKRQKGAMGDDTYEKLAGGAAKMLETPVRADELRGTQIDRQTSPPQNREDMQPDTTSDVVTDLCPLLIYRSAAGSAGGGNTLILMEKSIGAVERLKRYEFAKRAFYFEATDNRMADFARTRDLCLADPDKIPKEGDACLFVKNPTSPELDTVFRCLVTIGDDAWMVRAYNGPSELQHLPFSDYPEAWPVISVIRPG
jgi:hypothetical protein